MLLSVVVRTFAWIVVLGREGVVNQTLLWLGVISEPLRLLQTELGLVISLTQIEMPLMLLPLISVMSRLDPNLRDASAALGASRWRTLFTVIVPLSMPGLVAGCLLVFASSTTAFISQTVIGGVRLIYLPLVIWQQSLVVYNWPLAAVASLSLVVSVAVGDRRPLLPRPPVEPASPRVSAMGRRQSFLDISYSLVIGGIAILAVLIIVSPVVIALMISFTEGRSLKFPPTGFSFGWYEQLFDADEVAPDPSRRRQLAGGRGHVDPDRRRAGDAGGARPGAQPGQVGAGCRQLLHVAAGPARHHLRPGGAGLLLDRWASGRRST